MQSELICFLVFCAAAVILLGVSLARTRFTVQKIAMIGVMAALSFVAYEFFRIPNILGTGSSFHLGNTFTALTAMLLDGVSGVLAGAIIAAAATASNTAVYGISDTWTLRTICALLFPFGLGLVIVTGSELFTGNCMLPVALLDRRGTVGQMLRNWVLVYAGNLLGALLVAGLCVFCGQLDYSSGALAVYTIRVGAAKCALPFGNAFGLGILCNFLVCLGVVAANSAKDTAGRLMGAYLPVCFFVLCGFEHSIANLYYIGAALLAAAVPEYAAQAAEAGVNLSTLTLAGAAANLVPVTL